MARRIISFLWQLPQNILGLLVILFTRAKLCCNGIYKGIYISEPEKYWFGVSLGNFIIFGSTPQENSVLHEKGHQKQSIKLGWLYLVVIGIPSFCGNIFDRIFHRSWNEERRCRWYYAQPWEKWADRLGNVSRFPDL